MLQRCLFVILILIIYISLTQTKKTIFFDVCSSNPTVLDTVNENWNAKERSQSFVLKSGDGKDQYKFHIEPDISRHYGSYIRSAIFQATSEDGELVGNWDTHGGSLYESFCNDTRNSMPSVAVFESDANIIKDDLTVTWIPPSKPVNNVIIRALIYDSERRIHRLSPHKIVKRHEWLPTDFPSLDQCGDSKGCYLVPPNCQINECQYAMTWQSNGDSIDFELMGNVDGWIGVGFAKEKHNYPHEYLFCIRNDDNLIDHRISSTNQQNMRMYSTDSTYRRLRGQYNKQIYCAFNRQKFSDHHTGYMPISLSTPHYLIATYGNRGDISVNGPNFLFGNQNLIFSSTRVDFNKEAFLSYRYRMHHRWISKVYLCLMIVAWVLLASIAILTSRYYRPLWNSQSPRFGKKSWLLVHQPLVITIAVLTVVAFIFILCETIWTSSYIFRDMFWQPFLFICVLISSILNVALLMCIPKQQGRGYCIWFWIHWFVSSLAHCLAIPLIFLGMDSPRLDLWDWCSILLFAWCIFHIITDLILEIHYCMTYRRTYERFEEIDNKEGNFNRNEHRYPPGYQWKPFCLGFYIIVTSVVVIILLIAVIVYR